MITAQEDKIHQLDAVILSTHAISLWTDATANAVETMVKTLKNSSAETIVDSLHDSLDEVENYVQATSTAMGSDLTEDEFDQMYAEFIGDTVDTNTDVYLGMEIPTAPAGNLDVRARGATDRPRVVADFAGGSGVLQSAESS